MKTFTITFSLIIVSIFLSCSQKQETKLKSVFEIPENVTEENLIHFGYNKMEDQTVGYTNYLYKKDNLISHVLLFKGKITHLDIAVDTIIWNQLDKKMSTERISKYASNLKKNFVIEVNYATISGVKYECKLPLKREDAKNQGAYTNPYTGKKTLNYSENEFNTIELNRVTNLKK